MFASTATRPRFGPAAVLAAVGLALVAPALAGPVTDTQTTSTPTGTMYGAWLQTEAGGGWSRICCDGFTTTVSTTPMTLGAITCGTTTTVGGSFGVSLSGPNASFNPSVGVTYSRTYVPSGPTTTTTTTSTKYRHEYASTAPTANVNNATTTTAITLNTQSNINNILTDGAMTFDGHTLASGEVLRLDSVGPGSHQWVVNRTDGVNIETNIYDVTIKPAYTISPLISGHNIVPFSTARFTNNSADSILTTFAASTPFFGLVVGIDNTLFNIAPGESVDIPVYFSTAPGYLAELNQTITADLTATFAGTSDILATTSVSAVTIPSPGTAALLAAGFLVVARRRTAWR